MAFVFVPIKPDGEWYEVEVVCAGRENWWMWRGGKSDWGGVIGGGNGVVVVKCVVCKCEKVVGYRSLGDG